MNKMKITSGYKTLAIFIAPLIASLGTVPYSYQFAYLFRPYSYSLSIFLGLFFSITGSLANAALGAYSLLHLQNNAMIKIPNFLNASYLIFLSALSAVPSGCMFYFGYQDILPVLINFIIALIVIIINTAINYTALVNLFNEIFNQNHSKQSFSEKTSRVIGFLIGLLVSLTMFMATSDGLTHLLRATHLDKSYAFNLACLLAFITWIPVAALFSNSTQLIFGNIHQLMVNFLEKTKKINIYSIIILIIALGSGPGFLQMMIVFFNPERDIPVIFKAALIQDFIYVVLLPLGFISLFSVNYLALQKIVRKNEL